MFSRQDKFARLMEMYRKNPEQFTDEQAERIAQEARAMGIRFPRESKFGRKLAFDAVDSLALGMVPNSWRPKSRGEDTFGETETDKWAGRVGLLGAIPTLGAGWAGKGAIWAGGKAIGKAGLQAGAKGAGYAGNIGAKVGAKAMNKAKSFNWRPSVEKMGEGAGSLRQAWSSAGNAYRGARVKGVSSQGRGAFTKVLDDVRGVYYKGFDNKFANRTPWSPNQVPYSRIADSSRRRVGGFAPVRTYDRSLLSTIDPAML